MQSVQLQDQGDHRKAYDPLAPRMPFHLFAARFNSFLYISDCAPFGYPFHLESLRVNFNFWRGEGRGGRGRWGKVLGKGSFEDLLGVIGGPQKGFGS